jgi:uncharacterized phiE125 gp8 family phage protein
VILSSKLITGPIEEPVTLDEIKTHLRLALAFTDEDSYITGLISAARASSEKFTRSAFLTQTWEQYMDSFPHSGRDGVAYNRSMDRHCIHLLHPPLQSVTSVQYLDPGGALQTMDPTTYIVDTGSKPGRIHPKIGVPWPPTANLPKAVIVRFVAGVADTTAEALAADPGFNMNKVLIMQLVGHWYFNREPVVAGQVVELPLHIKQLYYNLRP